MLDSLKITLTNKTSVFAIVLFTMSTSWWIWLQAGNGSSNNLQLWAACYQAIAWYGAICGLIIARQWGGWRSAMGRTVIAFSLGLLLQGIGQSSYSFYIYFLHTEVPYPSIGDIGYFGSVITYTYAAIAMMRVIGSKISLGTYRGKLVAFLVPVLMLVTSYFLFLQGYEFDWSQPVKTFLDFGYPLGQAIYVSIAILAFLLSRNSLGGRMRTPILYLIVALIVQYTADFVFLLQANQETWYAGGINDLIYSFSYLLMAVALIFLGATLKQIKEN